MPSSIGRDCRFSATFFVHEGNPELNDRCGHPLPGQEPPNPSWQGTHYAAAELGTGSFFSIKTF
jgi:hypothetical protein